MRLAELSDRTKNGGGLACEGESVRVTGWLGGWFEYDMQQIWISFACACANADNLQVYYYAISFDMWW